MKRLSELLWHSYKRGNGNERINYQSYCSVRIKSQ